MALDAFLLPPFRCRLSLRVRVPVGEIPMAGRTHGELQEPKKLNPALIICIWIALSSSVVSAAAGLPGCLPTRSDPETFLWPAYRILPMLLASTLRVLGDRSYSTKPFS